MSMDEVRDWSHEPTPTPPSAMEEAQARLEIQRSSLQVNDPMAWGPWSNLRVRQLVEAAEVVARALSGRDEKFKAEYLIVDEVWRALGVESYEQANGKAIWELVADLKAQLHEREAELGRYMMANNRQAEEAERLREALDNMWGESQALRDAIVKHYGTLHPSLLTRRPAPEGETK